MLVPAPGVRGPIAKIAPLLVQGLRDRGHVVVTEPWGRHRANESLWAKVVGRTRDVLRIRRLAALEPHDLLLVHTSHEWRSLLRDIPLLAATRMRIRSIVLQHHGGRSERLEDAGPSLFKLATAAALRLSDGVLVLSSEERRALQRFSPTTRVCVVTNPFVPPSSTNALDDRRRGPAGPPVLLFAGRLIAEKGVYDVVAATAAVRTRVRCRLVIAGEGPEEAGLAALVRELGLEEEVSLVGYLGEEELLNAYSASDVFVFPTYWAEGFSTVLSEAMWAGLPIVTTRLRGTADHLKDGVHTLFVPPRDPVAVAVAVERLLTDHELRASMSRANREKVGEFAPQTVMHEYTAALKEIMGSCA
jgi:glycosyltransferase involved in cell wall biosynthesis